jgi:hypothetical protein
VPIESNEADPARAVGIFPRLHAAAGTMRFFEGSVLSCVSITAGPIRLRAATADARAATSLDSLRRQHADVPPHAQPYSGRWAVSLAAELFIVSRCPSTLRPY